MILPFAGFAEAVAPSASEARTPQDSTALAALDAKVDEYLAALETQPTEVKCTETDFIISSCTDSTVLTRVANRVYNHYFTSKLMGDDAVAIHIFDTWFADRAVKMGSEDEYFAATFFAATNRSSLIGLQAPKLRLYTPENVEVAIFGDSGSDSTANVADIGAMKNASTYYILFFYDVGCPTCMAETAKIRQILKKYAAKLTLYAVYIGSDSGKWAEYRRERFGDGVSGTQSQTAASDSVENGVSTAPNAEIIHLWDPEMKSNIAFDYGVIGTPRLFLISPEGKIVGRSLDSVALESLLDIILAPKTLEYGSMEAMEMYGKTFREATSCANVSEVAAHIEKMLLPRGDTLLFKQMTGDLLYFLTGRKEAKFKCDLGAFIDGFILNRPEIWNTADDSLQVVSLGSFLKNLLQLCPLGEKLPAIEVPVEVLTRGGRKSAVQTADAAETAQTAAEGITSKTATVRLDKLKDCTIMFYSPGCGLCAENLVGARNILRGGAVIPNTEIVPRKIILIDMDEIWSLEGEQPDELMTAFDLSTLPFIVCLDKRGRTAYKYADLR